MPLQIALFGRSSGQAVCDAPAPKQGGPAEIGGIRSSQPDLISNPNVGQPHSANGGVSRTPFLRPPALYPDRISKADP
jgi:hypothetical protein